MTKMPALKRIRTILTAMAKTAATTDQANATLSAHKLLKDQPLFSCTLFQCSSDKFFPYVKEIEQKTASFERLLGARQNTLATLALEQIEQQISALNNALNANNTLHYDAQYRQRRTAAQYQPQKIATAVVQPSQSLYQKLAEHHEFERRLAEMLYEREQQRSQSARNASQKLLDEILKLHQRLGRCRQAINQIERDIERAEKRL